LINQTDIAHNPPQKSEGGFIVLAKVYKNRKTWMVELWWDGVRYRLYHYDAHLTLVHRAMADRRAGEINGAIERQGKRFDPRQWFRVSGYEFQFDQYLAKWRTRQRYAPSVRGDVVRYMGYFADFFQKTDIREIKRGYIEDFLEWLPGHYAPKTRANILGLLHKMFSDALDSEMIDRIPGWPKIQVPQTEILWITREWQDRIIAEIPDRDKPIFIFLRTWGCRPGEARALMWDCVDFEKEIIWIKRTISGAVLQEHTKTRRIRPLPLTDELRDVFMPIRGLYGFVFRNHMEKRYSEKISEIWNEARDRAECPVKVTLVQGTRHSLATQHLDELPVMSRILGHSNINTTVQYYAGLNVEPMRRIGDG